MATRPPNFIQDACSMEDQRTVVVDNKVYVLGGRTTLDRSVFESDFLGAISNSHLRILDFTKSVDLTTTNVTSITPLPASVGKAQSANLFAADGKLHYFGGAQAIPPTLEPDGNFTQTPPRVAIYNRVWTYDIKTGTWPAAKTTGRNSTSISSAAIAYDPVRKTGWVYGGSYSFAEIYYVEPDLMLSAENMSDVQAGFDGISNTLTKYDLATGKTVDKSFPIVGVIKDGNMFFIPGAGDDDGLLVVLGGRNAASAPIPLDTVWVYDIATSQWFTQQTSAQGGNFPPPRERFCSVLASAPDSSSHNIYMYGGSAASNVVLNDVYILSLPSFQWIYVGQGDSSKHIFGHSCEVLVQRYMLSYYGSTTGSPPGTQCPPVGPQGVRLFDMHTLKWTTEYEFSDEPRYKVPQALTAMIGGNASGFATTLTPKDGFVDVQLETFFSKHTQNTTTTDTPSSLPPTATPPPGGSPPVSKGVIAGATIGALALLAIAAAIFFILREHRKRTRRLAVTEKLEMEAHLPHAVYAGAGAGGAREELGAGGGRAHHEKWELETKEGPVEMGGVGVGRVGRVELGGGGQGGGQGQMQMSPVELQGDGGWRESRAGGRERERERELPALPR